MNIPNGTSGAGGASTVESTARRLARRVAGGGCFVAIGIHAALRRTPFLRRHGSMNCCLTSVKAIRKGSNYDPAISMGESIKDAVIPVVWI